MSRSGRRSRRWHAILAAGAGTLALGCAASDDGVSRSDSDVVVDGGVGVVAEGCGLTAQVGSGVAVAHDGASLVVTVAHTIKGATEVRVVDADGTEHDARVVAFDKDADLAALDVEGTELPALEVAADPVTAVDADGTLLTWSRDAGVERDAITIVKRLRVTIEDIYVDDVVQRSALEIAGPVDVGDSGGPVLDADGDVVGIIYANSRRRDDVGFATDRAELAALIESVTGGTVDNGTCF